MCVHHAFACPFAVLMRLRCSCSQLLLTGIHKCERDFIECGHSCTPSHHCLSGYRVHSIKQPFHHASAPAPIALQVSLYDVTPSMCVGDLTKILDDFGRRR